MPVAKSQRDERKLTTSKNNFLKNAFICAFNVSTADPFIEPDLPHYCQRYAWSATFVGSLIGFVVSTCVFTGLPLVLGANPKFFMLDV